MTVVQSSKTNLEIQSPHLPSPLVHLMVHHQVPIDVEDPLAHVHLLLQQYALFTALQ